MEQDSIVRLEYDAWIVETNELFDTTHEELAKEEDLYNENVKYVAQPMIVGAMTVVKGLDDSLLKAEKDKEYEVEIPPDDAYGQRDPKLVELHSKREIERLPEFRKGDKDPFVGMQISMKGKIGTISSITAGRIRVDFNNRLAGRTLKYKYKITEIAESLEEKINAILEIHYGTFENFSANQVESGLDVIVPDACKYDQRWWLVKHRVVTDIQKYLGLETVKLVEEYKKREEVETKPEDSAEEVKTEEEPEVANEDSESEDVTVSIDQDVPETTDE